VCCRGLAGLKRIAGRVGGIRGGGGGGEDDGIAMLVRVGIAVTCSVVAYTVSYLTTRGGGTSSGSEEEEEEDLGNPALGNTTTGPAAAPGLVLPLLPSGTYQMKISLAHASLKQTIIPCPIQLPGHLQQQNPRVLEL
jgi:hypothetical protein